MGCNRALHPSTLHFTKGMATPPQPGAGSVDDPARVVPAPPRLRLGLSFPFGRPFQPLPGLLVRPFSLGRSGRVVARPHARPVHVLRLSVAVRCATGVRTSYPSKPHTNGH